MGLTLTNQQLKDVTAHTRELADEKRLEISDVEEILYRWANGAVETEPTGK